MVNHGAEVNSPYPQGFDKDDNFIVFFPNAEQSGCLTQSLKGKGFGIKSKSKNQSTLSKESTQISRGNSSESLDQKEVDLSKAEFTIIRAKGEENIEQRLCKFINIARESGYPLDVNPQWGWIRETGISRDLIVPKKEDKFNWKKVNKEKKLLEDQIKEMRKQLEDSSDNKKFLKDKLIKSEKQLEVIKTGKDLRLQIERLYLAPDIIYYNQNNSSHELNNLKQCIKRNIMLERIKKLKTKIKNLKKECENETDIQNILYENKNDPLSEIIKNADKELDIQITIEDRLSELQHKKHILERLSKKPQYNKNYFLNKIAIIEELIIINKNCKLSKENLEAVSKVNEQILEKINQIQLNYNNLIKDEHSSSKELLKKKESYEAEIKQLETINQEDNKKKELKKSNEEEFVSLKLLNFEFGERYKQTLDSHNNELKFEEEYNKKNEKNNANIEKIKKSLQDIELLKLTINKKKKEEELQEKAKKLQSINSLI